MLRKEIQGVLRQSLFFLAVTAGVSLIIKIALAKHVGTYLEVFYTMFQFSLLVFGAYMGSSVFLTDKNQGAEDYVFSLPYSRLKLLAIKVLPRLIAVVIFYLLFLALYLGGEGVILKETFFTVSWLYWLFFLVSLSFSASADNFMKVGGIALIGIVVFLQLIVFSRQLAFLLKTGQFFPTAGWDIFTLMLFGFSNIVGPSLVVNFCLLIPFLIAFVFTYKKWGTYAKGNYNKGFFKLFLPLMAAGFILSTLFIVTQIGESYHEYYLTTKHQLVETDGMKTRLFESDREVKLKCPQGILRVFFEDEQYIYGSSMTSKSNSIIRIHKENYKVEILREGPCPSSWYYRYRIRIFKHIIMVPEYYKTPSLRAFVFIDTRSKAIKKMKTYDTLPHNYYNPVIFGADVDEASGKIFWLIHSERTDKYPIVRLWEDGKTEILCHTRLTPLYINRLLLTCTDQALVISKISGDAPEVLKEIPKYKYVDISRLYDKINLNPISTQEVFFVLWIRGGGKYLRLNLETFAVTEILKFTMAEAQNVFIRSGKLYKIEFSRDVKEPDANKRRYYLNKIYRQEGEELKLLKEFPAYETMYDGDRFWINDNGVIIRYNKQLSVYSLPDMKQLKFKK